MLRSSVLDLAVCSSRMDYSQSPVPPALNEQGFPPDVIEAALAHVDKNEVRRAYNRSDYLEQRRPMMQWWADFIKEADSGSIIDGGNKGLRLVG